MPDHIKRQIRRKFRATVINFYKRIKAGESCQLPALDALKEFQDEREKQKSRLEELKYMIEQDVPLQERRNLDRDSNLTESYDMYQDGESSSSDGDDSNNQSKFSKNTKNFNSNRQQTLQKNNKGNANSKINSNNDYQSEEKDGGVNSVLKGL